jgi:hypothetical protein
MYQYLGESLISLWPEPAMAFALVHCSLADGIIEVLQSFLPWMQHRAKSKIIVIE